MNPIRFCADNLTPSALMITAILSAPASLFAQDQAEQREAELRAAVERGIDAFADREFGAARAAFAEARAADAPLAHFFNGLMHQHGLGGPFRIDRAEICLETAAERRVIPAMFALAELSFRRSDESGEKRWLRQAAHFDHLRAQVIFATRMLESSDGSEQVEGARFAILASEKGGLSREELDRMLEQFSPQEIEDLRSEAEALKVRIRKNLDAGIYRIDMPFDEILKRGVERPGVLAADLYLEDKFVEAFDALRPLAEAGDTTGCFYLARMYQLKLTRELDQARAVRWYTRASLADDESSMRNLAWMLLQGEHVEADPVAARDLFIRSAFLGHQGSMFDLGYLYREGKAGEADPVEACAWYRLAIEHGESSAQTDYDEVAMTLGSPERERIHRRIDELREILRTAAISPDLPPVPYLDAARRQLGAAPNGSVFSRALDATTSETGSGQSEAVSGSGGG